MAKTTKLPRLGELEMQILEHLWAVGEADVQETYKHIGVPRGISLNTVGSALERLFRKELLGREKVSHAYRYRPSIERNAAMVQAMIDAAGGLRALSEQGLLTAFVDVLGDASDETLDSLEQLIAEKRSQKS